MEAKKSNKIREIVKLQQILKKWRKVAHASKQANNNKIDSVDDNNNNININLNRSGSGSGSGSGSKSIKFLKRTLSFTDTTAVPKGYLAVSVGKEEKRYKIPTDYLSHQAFHVLLREAEEEFGFQQAGILRIPCEVAVFESILKIMEDNKNDAYLNTQECRFNATTEEVLSYRHPSDCPRTPSHQPHSPMCR
ncbi:PREDICTED: auxin-responsive protein SAUR63-like [Camelina sativa]|uniref:Auxin-responsive protein SAUR63-like n=1 Tax=Camelina sativa TaxID=90675 RepID=A0ABM1QSF6_CAMSA|nr:PREDICTED: auxin-responsive protein SAUR63-like [Camelina sativa]